MNKNILLPLRRLHGHLHECRLSQIKRKALRNTYKQAFHQKKKKNPNTVYLILTPEHTNLGDHAIAFAEIELLREIGVDYVEITGKQLMSLQKEKILNLMNGSPILINGGGNLGTLWFDVERLMRDIIIANPKSPIFILPNTIYYENTPWGRKEFECSKKIYNAHNKLFIYAREHTSLKTMQGIYRNVKLIPDMVLRLNRSESKLRREGCLLCLREDREKTITKQDELLLSEKLRAIFGDNVRRTDMHAPHEVPIADRELELEKKYAEFQQSALVVTDRLHGMIFCAITGTPCIVVNSRSPKVKGCYEWLKDLNSIKFCNNIMDIFEIVPTIIGRSFFYDNKFLSNHYEPLIEDLKSIL